MSIRRPWLVALVCATTLALGGCVQLHTETVIDERGGGSATITMSMSQAVSEAMAEMEQLDAGGGPGGGPGGDMPEISFDDIDRETIEKRLADFDVEITRFEKGVVDGRETLNIAYEFEDLRGFSAMMQATMPGDEDEGGGNGLGIFAADDGNLVLRPASYDLPAWDEADEEPAPEQESAPADMDPAAMQKQMEILGKLMGAMSELDIRMAITVPGDIVSTNAPQQEGRTSIWAINAQNAMSAPQTIEPRIVFSGKGLEIEPQQD